MASSNQKRAAIARRVKMARGMAGLSQAQAARMLGIHRPSLSEAEAGRRKVSAEELSQLAEIYQVDLGWLADGREQPDSAVSDRIGLAARELSKLKAEDLDRVMQLLKAIRPRTDAGS